MGNCLSSTPPADDTDKAKTPEKKTKNGVENDNKNETKSTTDVKKKKKRAQKKRSGSMQFIWSNSWNDLIEDRDKNAMKQESNLSKCNHKYDECNCIQRTIFVMNIYKFWNDRKHIELDIDHIVSVITTELDNYSSQQMISDFKHSKQVHNDTKQLTNLFQTKCKNCGGDECSVLLRKNNELDDNKKNDINNNDVQRTSTFSHINPISLRLMNILDDYHCYFLHNMDNIRSVNDE